MILGHGVDIIEIARFEHWQAYPHNHLLKLFNAHEISYCLNEPAKSAERFAARFAAKEALYKALCQAMPDFSMPFLTLCKKAWVDSSNRVPHFVLDFEIPRNMTCKLSISHSKINAIASLIILEKPDTNA